MAHPMKSVPVGKQIRKEIEQIYMKELDAHPEEEERFKTAPSDY